MFLNDLETSLYFYEEKNFYKGKFPEKSLKPEAKLKLDCK